MLRCTILLAAGLALFLGAGCTTTPTATPQRDPQFDQKKLERERDDLSRRLTDERAKTAALQKEIDGERKEWNAAQAQVGVLQADLDALRKKYDEVRNVVDQLKNKPLERPVVPPSPLPAELDQALQTFVSKYPGRVWYERGRGAVSFANDRLFDAGSDAVRADARAGIEELAGILAKTPADAFDVIVVGHTDDSAITRSETLAKHPTNWHLSVHRAIAVLDVLTRAGLPAARLGVMGYGQYRPLGEDRAQNRRVEVFVVPKGAVQGLEPVRAGKKS